MHQLGIVGVSHRHADADKLAQFFIAKQDLPACLPRLREALGVAEIVYLGTCNRVEFIFSAPDGLAAEDLRCRVARSFADREIHEPDASRELRTWTGEAAVEHLFLVACGLDSAQVGEREIAAQLRASWDAAREAGVSGPILDKVLSEALAMSRRAQQMDVGHTAPSLADLGAGQVLKHLKSSAGPVALIGVSPMTRRCGLSLREQGVVLVVVNRSLEPAQELARDLGATAMTLETFRHSPPPVSASVVATGSAESVLDRPALERMAAAAAGAAQLILDFSSPNNVDPKDAAAAGIRRVGMDELVALAREHRMAHLVRLAPIRAAIDERLARLRSELATRSIGTRLATLRHTVELVVSGEVEKLLASELRDLDAERREAVRRWAATLAHRLAHMQLSGVRAAAEHASAEALDAFFEGAKLGRMQ